MSRTRRYIPEWILSEKKRYSRFYNMLVQLKDEWADPYVIPEDRDPRDRVANGYDGGWSSYLIETPPMGYREQFGPAGSRWVKRRMAKCRRLEDARIIREELYDLRRSAEEVQEEG